MTGAEVTPKLQAIFAPANSTEREFDLKEAAQWGHHAHLDGMHRDLPEFEVGSVSTTGPIG